MKLPKSIVFILGGIMVLIVIITIITLISSFFSVNAAVFNFKEMSPSALATNQEFGVDGSSSHLLKADIQKTTVSYPLKASC